MAAYGLLIDYEYCTNCGACVVSCKEEHGYPVGQWGIRLHCDGPWAIDDESWNWNWYPLPTDLCDLCAERTAKGREPICAHHCLANIISYGPVEELAKSLAQKPKQLLVVPQYKPKEARGPFVHKENITDAHRAAHIEVSGMSEVRLNTDRSDGYEDA
jgi:anaerobic dimethyl sulfoxide reductase subunit B (iron-sulfur subunit)